SCEVREGAEQELEQALFDARVPKGEPPPAVPILWRPEMASGELHVASDASDAAVERRVAALEAGVVPAQALRFEVQRTERRARSSERKEPGAHVVDQAGPRELRRCDRAPGTARVCLQHQHLQ